MHRQPGYAARAALGIFTFDQTEEVARLISEPCDCARAVCGKN
jgi:hypothetical protein